MKSDSKSGIIPFYEDLGKELDVEHYKVDTSWKVEALLQVMPNRNFTSVLELGCGGGLVLKGVSEAVGADKRIGVDIAPSMLSRAQRECPDALFLKGGAANLPFKDRSIDLVILCDILEHVYHPDMLIREAQRVGRYVAIKVPLEKCLAKNSLRLTSKGKARQLQSESGHLYAWGKKDVLSLFRTAGLEPLSLRLVDPPDNVRNYNNGERFNFLPFGKKMAVFLDRTIFKLPKPVYHFLMGSTLVAFVKA